MTGNMNDGFDGFGGDDFDTGFGDGGFGDGGFGDGGFGDDDAFSGAGQQDMGQGNQFSDSLNNLDNQNQYLDTQAEQQNTKKQSIIFIIVGVVVLMIVLVIADIFNNKPKNNSAVSNSNTNNTQVIQQDPNVNVDNIMGGGNSSTNQQSQNNNKQSVVTNKVDSGFTWTLITDSEAVQFNNEYSDMTFTITGIEHKARAVDTNSNLVVITTLHGSISGLSGTYELDVPYNKGVKLVVGNSFTVRVQLGTYNGKTVVGEIQY